MTDGFSPINSRSYRSSSASSDRSGVGAANRLKIKANRRASINPVVSGAKAHAKRTVSHSGSMRSRSKSKRPGMLVVSVARKPRSAGVPSAASYCLPTSANGRRFGKCLIYGAASARGARPTRELSQISGIV
jgi:hypothetical protein